MTRRLLLLVLAVATLIGGAAAAQSESPRSESPRANRGQTGARSSPPLSMSTDAALVHVLRRVTYGPRPGDLERVKAVGLAAWLERQLQPERIDDSAVERDLAALPTLGMSIAELQRAYPRPDPAMREKLARGDMSPREMREQYPMDKRPARIVGELQTARMLRAVASERQLQEVMVDFWFNHFNVFAGKGERALVRDRLRARRRFARTRSGGSPTCCARPRGIPRCSSTSTTGSARGRTAVLRGGPNAGRLAGLNENYARELMELHTLGVDGGYTQRDVTEVARAFTGWTIDRPPRGRALRVPVGHARLRRQARPRANDPGRRRARRRARARHARPASRRPRASSPPSWSAASWPTIRRRRWSSAWPPAIGRRTATSAPCCG